MDNTTKAPREVARRIREDDADDLYVLDVRNEAEYEERNIEGSVNLPVYDELLEYDYSTLEARLDVLPTETEIAVVCVGGVTSARAAEFLRQQGFDAKSVDGGMNEWSRLRQR